MSASNRPKPTGARAPTPLAWSSIGLAIAASGLILFVLHLSGRAHSMGPRRGSHVSPEVGMLFGLVLGTGGVATLWRGLTATFPSLAARRWFRWSASLVLISLLLSTTVLAALVLGARVNH